MSCVRLLGLLLASLFGFSAAHAQPMMLDGAFAPSVDYEYNLIRGVRCVGVAGRKLVVWHPNLGRVNGTPVSHGLARLLPDGSLDTTFTAQLLPGDIVREVVALTDGRVIVITASTTEANPARVVRLLATGQTDPDFAPAALSASASARLALLSDNRVIVWGSFASVGGTVRNGLAFLLTDGRVDPAFAPALTDDRLYVQSAIATHDDRLVLSAQSYSQTGAGGYFFCRLSPTGAVDPAFAPTVPPRTFSFLGRLSDDRMLISDYGIRLLKPDGSDDPTFSPQIPGLQSGLRTAMVLPGDRLAVEANTGGPAPTVFVLNADGTLVCDGGKLPGAERIQSLCAALPDGKVAFVQGPLIWELAPWTELSSWYVPGMTDARLCVLDPAVASLTALPTTLDGGGSGSIRRLSLDAEGSILAEGNFTRIAGLRRAGCARFNRDGTIDPTFDPVAITPLFYQPDGRAIGTRTTLGSADPDGFHPYVTQLVRRNTDGTLDPTFTPAADLDLINAAWLASAPDGRILVCASAGGTAEANAKLVWLASDGSRGSTLQTTFAGLGPIYGGSFAVRTAALAPDGKLLLNVLAEQVNGSPVPQVPGVAPYVAGGLRVVRLNVDGSTDTSFHPNATGLKDIDGIKFLPDGRLFVYGTRLGVGWTQPGAVLRLNADGSPDTFVNRALADGLPLADGSFLYGSARYRPDGTYDRNFELQIDYGYTLQAAVLAGDGALWIGGTFTKVGSQPRSGFARLLPAEVAGFTAQPNDARTIAGYDVTFDAEIGTAAPATFQWTFNGSPIPGATRRTLTLVRPELSAAGVYRLVSTVGGQTYTSEPATLTVDPNTARLVNFSARCVVSSSSPTQIGGFVLRGALSRPILLRAVGRGLPLDNPGFALLPEPTLRLFQGPRLFAEDTAGALAPAIAEAARQLGAVPLRSTSPADEPTRDSALLRSLPAGAYTAHVASRNGRAGVSLFEFYDGDPANDTPAVANVSIRGRAAHGDEVLIAGFVVRGSGLLRLLIRGIGPGLEPFGVTDAITDPQLTLYRENTALLSNDNWTDQPDVPLLTAAAQRSGAFSLSSGSRDAALLVELPPGIYSVHGSAVDQSAGEMMIELYAVPD